MNATRRVRTFDALRLTAKDHIDVDTASNLHLDLPAERQPHVPGQILNNMFTLVDVHPRYSVSAARLRGFLYYHVPYPSQFLSGSLRFRCTPSREPSTFDQGHDLPNRHDLPWNIPLARMIGRLKLGIFVNQLVLDGLLTEEQVSKARRLLAYNPEKEDHPRPSFVHGIGQPFAIDLTVPLRIAVTGPHKVFSSTIYPAVTFRGACPRSLCCGGLTETQAARWCASSVTILRPKSCGYAS